MRASSVFVALVVAIAGCGRIAFDPLSSPGDASSADASNDAPASDAGVDAPMVPPDAASDAAPLPDAPFGPPVLVTELSSPAFDDDPTLTDDQLEIFFASNRVGGRSGDLWTATRPSTSDPWNAPIPIEALNTTTNDACPSISPDGLTLFFCHAVAGETDLYYSVRATRSSPWAPRMPIPELANVGSEEIGPSLTADAKTIYFASDRTGDFELYVATRPLVTVPWGAPVGIAELSSPLIDTAPTIADDGLTLWFASSRAGTLGRQDVYVAARAGPGDPFVSTNVTEINTADSETDPWISPDGRTLYFARVDAAGDSEIFVAERTSP